jgi:hypothetical protein
MSERQELHNFLIKNHFNDGVLNFETILKQAGENVFDKQGLDLSLFVQSTLNRHWNNTLKLIYEDEKRNLEPIFTIVDKKTKLLEYSNHSSKGYKAKLNRDRVDFLNEIDSINDREYEAFCCVVLKNLGANNILLTSKGNEGGIDFVGTIKFGKKAHFLFGVNGPLRIIGQSKYYDHKVSVKEIKEFDSTISDIQRLSPKVNFVLPNWFKKEKGPIIGWFIAHSSFQSGANDRSKNFGFINSDSRDLVEILSKSKKFYPNIPTIDRVKKIKKEINEFLTKNEYNK